MTDKNPKLEGSELIDVIPQTGFCPNRCPECYYNNGFFRDLNEPLIPTLEEVGDKIVRVNSGHDSNINKKLVLDVTSKYPKKFYNTAIFNFDFPAPVVYTCNSHNTDILITEDQYEKKNTNFDNLMAVRFKVNSWNLELCDRCVNFFTSKNIPVLLTFLRYKLFENVKNIIDYEYKKHILNSYWLLKKEAWNAIANRYKSNPLVYLCGKEYGNDLCKNCNNCAILYKRLEK